MKNLKRKLILGSSFLILVMSFQNCSDFSLNDQVAYEQGIFDSREALDSKTLPGLLEAETLSLWSKADNLDYVKKDPFLANQWSMIVAVDRAVTGTILTLNSNTNTEETSLSVIDGKLRATHISTADHYSFMEVPMPTAGEDMVVAASFGIKPTEISLMVNGIVQTAEIQKVGTPVDFSYLVKSISAGGTAGQVIEYMVYGGYDEGAMTHSELNVLSRYIANNNMIANVVFDPVLVGDGTGGTTTPGQDNSRFLAAKAVIDGKCLACHSSSNNGDFRNMTESKAVQMGLIVAGDPQNSKLYYRLKDSTGGPLGDSKRDMPQGNTLTSTEVQAIYDWIANFK